MSDHGQQTLQLLESVLIERLDKYQTWALSCAEDRVLLARELARSVSEIVRQITPSQSPSGAPPSILVSPISQSASRGVTSVFQTPASSIPPSPIDPTAQDARRGSATFLLSPRHPSIVGQHDYVPSNKAPTIRMPTPRMDMPKATSASQVHTVFTPPSFDAAVSSHVQEDLDNGGYGQESGSWNQGDDHAIGLAFSNDYSGLNFGFEHNPLSQATAVHTGLSRFPNQLPSRSFTPVKVASLADLPQGQGSITTDIQATCSNRTLDSGYGSVNSRRHEVPECQPPLPDAWEEEGPNLDALDAGLDGLFGVDDMNQFANGFITGDPFQY